MRSLLPRLGDLIYFAGKSNANSQKNVEQTAGQRVLYIWPYFCNYRNMASGQNNKKSAEQVARYADMLSAMGTEPRLRIVQLLLSAHPEGLVVGDIQEELEIPNSTLSHHLDKLKNENLVQVKRESTFLRYTANTEALQELMQFLYSECCTRNKALRPRDIVEICR
jgi:ArsR family transcriptional regulator, arsenate/arsenite/antimonite-responsive transcriptional repressor